MVDQWEANKPALNVKVLEELMVYHNVERKKK
mgnify:CR=1 FL=1